MGRNLFPPLRQSLEILAAKARAILRGNTYVSSEDVRAIASPVLRHRVVMSYEAQAELLTSDEIVRRILERVPTP